MTVAFFRELEIRLMDPALRGSREDVSALLAEDFVEFASNGHIYDKPGILDALAAEAVVGAPERAVADFAVRMLAPNVALVTYRAEKRGIRSLRSSIWKQVDGNWRMTFHQGTPT
jgi:hypothetical protein